jgi:hypothetical protein
MASVRLRFCPGFLRGAGFSGEKSHNSWPRRRKPGFRRANCSSVFLELRQSSSLRNPISAGAVLTGIRTPPEQSSPESELRWSSLTLPLQKGRSGEELHRSSRTTLEQIAPLKILFPAHRLASFLKRFIVKRHKNKRDPQYFKLQLSSTKPSVGLPNIVITLNLLTSPLSSWTRFQKLKD